MEAWLLALLPSLTVGIILAYWNRKQNKKDAVATEKEKVAKRKDYLQISLLLATAELSYATTMAIKRGSPNGEVETAVERYNKAMEDFKKFERDRLYCED